MSLKIGIVGELGSGKTTVATYMTQEWKFRDCAFATPLKKMIIELFGIDPKYVYETQYKEQIIPEWGVSGRTLMQRIGTDIMRETLPRVIPELDLEGKSIWVERARVVAKKNQSEGYHTVFSDVRFENEANFVKEAGGILIEILRPENKEKDVSATAIHISHKSEVEQKNIKTDYQIINDGTIADLHKKIYDLISTLIHRNTNLP